MIKEPVKVVSKSNPLVEPLTYPLILYCDCKLYSVIRKLTYDYYNIFRNSHFEEAKIVYVFGFKYFGYPGTTYYTTIYISDNRVVLRQSGVFSSDVKRLLRIIVNTDFDHTKIFEHFLSLSVYLEKSVFDFVLLLRHKLKEIDCFNVEWELKNEMV